MLAVVAFGLAAEACGAPPESIAPDSPAARATSVSRAAAARVQQIIANKPTATPPADPTPTPLPTCSNAIWWTEARSHIGETRTVQGTVVGIRAAAGGAVLLELGQPYPDPTGLPVSVPAADPSLSGRTICASGRISLSEDGPILQVTDPARVSVVN
jgi:hypothetical protein